MLMTQDETEEYWNKLKKAALDLAAADENFKVARDAVVSRLCFCYRKGENWEDRAVWCSYRMTNTCPYFLEYKKRKI